MSKIHPQFRKAAKAAADAAIEEVKLFCKIMCYPETDIHLVGEDPHGVVSIGDDFYNMTDIHVVISEYDHWISIYGSDNILRSVIWQWYDWRTDWYNKHPRMEWVDASKSLPIDECDFDGKHEFVLVQSILDGTENEMMPFMACYSDRLKDWQRTDWNMLKRHNIKVTHWLKLIEPDNTHDINLKSWLMGCPVEGLREATPAYDEQQEQGIKEAHERTEQARTEIDEEMEEHF